MLPAEANDQYGRTVGVVMLDDRNINLEMVKEGWAWRYPQYDKPGEYTKAEKDAREKKLGLWVDKDPMPPWEFRKAQREKRQSK